MSSAQQIGASWGGSGGSKSRSRADCYPLWKKVIIEALATYVVLLVHFLVAACFDASTDAGKLAIALTQGLVVFHIVAVFWRSGPHANFWVSILSFMGKGAPRLNAVSLIAYFIVQVGFAVLAGLTARAILGAPTSPGDLGTPVITTSIGIAILVESLLSFIFNITVLVVSVNYQKSGLEGLKLNNPALVIGLTHAVLVAVGLGSGTGGCVNSLRHFGVAVWTTFTSDSWVYYVSHLIGAIVAVIVFLVVLKERGTSRKRN